MKENSIRRAVREGRAALGTGLKEFATRGVPHIIQSAGFDCCMIDMEHGAFDLETIADLAGWFAATDISPIVRIHKAFVHHIPLMTSTRGLLNLPRQDRTLVAHFFCRRIRIHACCWRSASSRLTMNLRRRRRMR